MSTPDLRIRAATPDDAPAVLAMQSLPGFRRGTLRLPFPHLADVRRWLEGQGGESRELLAFAADTLVGIGGLHVKSGRQRHIAGLGMGVHDAWTGRGIGRALMTELLDYADRWLGLLRVELSVYTDNAPALALYRRSGFVVEGTERGAALRDGVFVDAHLMARLQGELAR